MSQLKVVSADLVPQEATPEELISAANEGHRSVGMSIMDGLGHAKSAGDLLVQAREHADFKKGGRLWKQWLPTLKERFDGTQPTATQYMRISRNWSTLKNNKDIHTFSDAIKLLSNRKESNDPEFSSIIKPSDNWKVNPSAYPKIDDSEGHGYIPGDIYANVFWYWVQPGETFVDLMAGSGMALHVYNDRKSWMNGHKYDFNVKLYDLNPRGKYKKHIKKCDVSKRMPCKADIYFADVPYFRIVEGQYSKSHSDIANQELGQWVESITNIATLAFNKQSSGGRFVFMVPQFSDVSSQEELAVPSICKSIFEASGYRVSRIAYASRCIQKASGATMANLNNIAKDRRIMLSDMSEIICFAKP